MKVCIDVETTTHNKGNPYDPNNYLVSIHAYYDGKSWTYKPDQIGEVGNLVEKAKLLVFFNGKFDITWLRKYGLSFIGKKIYDVQLAHYYLTDQQDSSPSLNSVAQYYGLPGKVDKIAEYWDKGVQTDEIPWNELKEYGERDAQLTYELFERQQFDFTPQKKVLFNVACQDLLVLQEMEWNGIHYDEDLCHSKSKQIQEQIDQLTNKLSGLYPDITINFNSNDQLSAFLYGGTIKELKKEFDGFYKSGKREGQARYKNVKVFHSLPRLFEPLKKTEMLKEGIFSTSEGTLRKLKGKQKWIIETLLLLAKLEKLKSTYYDGIPKLNRSMSWPRGILHGNFNQCIARTGRLSSSKPNLQNFSGETLDVFITRFHSVLQSVQEGHDGTADETLSASCQAVG